MARSLESRRPEALLIFGFRSFAARLSQSFTFLVLQAKKFGGICTPKTGPPSSVRKKHGQCACGFSNYIGQVWSGEECQNPNSRLVLSKSLTGFEQFLRYALLGVGSKCPLNRLLARCSKSLLDSRSGLFKQQRWLKSV